MQNKLIQLKNAAIGDTVCGFCLEKKEFVKSQNATFYTLVHLKTRARLYYFDRDDENKTFCVSFKTLPEDDTGVFHILEHSVLNGSKKYPVKEPFVSMLQSSMQTFLNAMTYGDKTVFPVSSRNDKDFFNLMSVYLDAVFCPSIYSIPEIFMQEGWHYEFDEDGNPFYNGVVFSEMKGAFADVDGIMYDETARLVFPDNCYGFTSGGHPEHITDLTYEQFINTHKRFYHPSNSVFFLDGHMDIDAVLEYIDSEYLSNYEYEKPDFDFVEQIPKTGEKTVYYAAREDEAELAHISISKILCKYDETEKIYAAHILSDYLTGSNEAPLKRAFLEKGLAQDAEFAVYDGIYQPFVSFVAKNVNKDSFDEIKTVCAETAKQIAQKGLNKESLRASLERFAFRNKEISEPYGLELAIKSLDSCLYGGEPLVHIENAEVFEDLKNKIQTDYFENLLEEMLADTADKSYLYVLPSLAKGEEDAAKEAKKVENTVSAWSEKELSQVRDAFLGMQQWQQTEDSEENLATLPHLDLKDVPVTPVIPETELTTVDGTAVLKTVTATNGIVYLNMYFDISDFSVEELQTVNVLITCLGELKTGKYSAEVLQTKIKTVLGSFNAKIELMAETGNLSACKPYLRVSAAMLEENAAEAVELIAEILSDGCYDETDKIYEMIVQDDYMLKQSLIGKGHIYAITKSLSAFSASGTVKEFVEGESFNRWFSKFVGDFKKNETQNADKIAELASKIFVKERLFVGYSGNFGIAETEKLIHALPHGEIGAKVDYTLFDKNECAVEIPSGVGYSALGNNVYSLGTEFNGAYSVLSSLVSYMYLWNVVRVRGGAYGTGMSVKENGDVFCYSYRDPNLVGTKSAFSQIPEFLDEFLEQGIPLDDIIIGTVNTTEPLLDPSAVCETQCKRFLNGVTAEKLAKIRKEVLNTKPEDLAALLPALKEYVADGKFCAVGDKNTINNI